MHETVTAGSPYVPAKDHTAVEFSRRTAVTLVKLLANRLAPFSGSVTRADKLSIAYFAQHQLDELNEDGSTYDHVRRLMPDAPESRVRARAGAIGFPEAAADTPSGSLSGGEKARLLLGLATLAGPHGLLSIEAPHLLRLVEGVQFDTLYHEHYFYWSLAAMEHLLARHCRFGNRAVAQAVQHGTDLEDLAYFVDGELGHHCAAAVPTLVADDVNFGR